MIEAAWSLRGESRPEAFQIKAIDDEATRHEARRLFHTGYYGRAAELLAEVGSRQRLTPAETKMLELARKRVNPGVPPP